MEDYIKDGLLHCGKCNTQKETMVDFFGVKQKMPCICECEYQEEKRLQRENRIATNRTHCFADYGFGDCTFATDDGKGDAHAMSVAKKYAENFEDFYNDGIGLLIYGAVGVGKSYMSACIANAIIETTDKTCYMTNFTKIINDLWNAPNKRDYLSGLNGHSLLIIDDLARERDSEYANEIVASVIDDRCRAKLPLIVTTNLTAEEMRNVGDLKKQRIFSRLFEICLPVEVKGEDRRRSQMVKNFSKYKDMLGL